MRSHALPSRVEWRLIHLPTDFSVTIFEGGCANGLVGLGCISNFPFRFSNIAFKSACRHCNSAVVIEVFSSLQQWRDKLNKKQVGREQ
jgi:hypothetical protein